MWFAGWTRRCERGSNLPAGYRLALGGQFEEGARSLRNLTLLGGLILIGMYGLLFVAFGSHRHAAIVLVNLPLALIGACFAIALSGGVVSVGPRWWASSPSSAWPLATVCSW